MRTTTLGLSVAVSGTARKKPQLAGATVRLSGAGWCKMSKAKHDPHIYRRELISATCVSCGARTDAKGGKAHLVDTKFYCDDCCPQCKGKS
jgi:hypothetical protein